MYSLTSSLAYVFHLAAEMYDRSFVLGYLRLK